MVLRQRIKKVFDVKTVKELDAFPKVDDDFKEGSPVGGVVFVLSYFIMIYLALSEADAYLNGPIAYKFLPDTDFDQTLQVNIDLTVAMPCPTLGADILDSTGQNLMQFGILREEDTWFELDAHQRRIFNQTQRLNTHLRSEYHEIHDYLWKSPYISTQEIPPRQDIPKRPQDACRIYGKLDLNKVAGNFHITAGKSLQLPQGHIHLSPFLNEHSYNFSHRIDGFSFGENAAGLVHPLNGDEHVTEENMMLYQYFIEVVPTEIQAFKSLQTFQYSVKSHSRPINHLAGSHGIPGIYFKYDMSAMKVRVWQNSPSFLQLLVKVCAIVGGVYVTSGFISAFLQFVCDRIYGSI